jgi:hypothetical protein
MRHHVEDSGLMYQDDDALTGPEYAQFLRVWEQRIADYVAALAPKP